jgi:multidrug efflux system membrane fusion protein
VKPGNIVSINQPNSTTLVNIQEIEPIYVQFSVPEQYLSDIRTYKQKGTLKVGAYFKDSSDESKVEYGDLTFINNAIDTSTGTIMLKALYQNKDEMLWPGQFVNVTLTLTEMPDAVVVPTMAIQVSQEGQYVFVVQKNNIVQARPIVSNYSYNHESIIEKGVSAGEIVITDGQLQLVDGSKVEFKNKLDTGNTNQ